VTEDSSFGGGAGGSVADFESAGFVSLAGSCARTVVEKAQEKIKIAAAAQARDFLIRRTP
jgi:hypothetical protein